MVGHKKHKKDHKRHNKKSPLFCAFCAFLWLKPYPPKDKDQEQGHANQEVPPAGWRKPSCCCSLPGLYPLERNVKHEQKSRKIRNKRHDQIAVTGTEQASRRLNCRAITRHIRVSNKSNIDEMSNDSAESRYAVRFCKNQRRQGDEVTSVNGRVRTEKKGLPDTVRATPSCRSGAAAWRREAPPRRR